MPPIALTDYYTVRSGNSFYMLLRYWIPFKDKCLEFFSINAYLFLFFWVYAKYFTILLLPDVIYEACFYISFQSRNQKENIDTLCLWVQGSFSLKLCISFILCFSRNYVILFKIGSVYISFIIPFSIAFTIDFSFLPGSGYQPQLCPPIRRGSGARG